MQKRGQSEVLTLTFLFEVLAGLLMSGLLIYGVLTTGNMQDFNKNYVKADFELMISIVKSVPGDVEMEYDTGGYYYKDGDFFKDTDDSGKNLVKIIKKDGDISVQNAR